MSAFGLIIRKKSAAPSIRSGLDDLMKTCTSRRRDAIAAFNDEDDEDSAKEEKKAASSSSLSAILKKRAEMEHAKALAEDPTVFEYDTIHDEIVSKRTEKMEDQKKADVERKPKYVPALLRAAKRRELDHEAREDRKQQKERVEEGKTFEDKEVFVTGAYRKRMEEVNEYQQEEDRKDEIMGRMDVTKQRDLSGFYRHMLNDISRGPTIPKIKTEVEDPIEEMEEATGRGESKQKSESERAAKDKAYRKRKRSSSPESDTETRPAVSKPTEQKNKKHTIYSDSSDEERPPTPPPSKKGGLEVLKKPKEKERSGETKAEMQKRRYFTPSPPSSPLREGGEDEGHRKRSHKSESHEEKSAEVEEGSRHARSSLGVMGDVAVFGKRKTTKKENQSLILLEENQSLLLIKENQSLLLIEENQSLLLIEENQSLLSIEENQSLIEDNQSLLIADSDSPLSIADSDSPLLIADSDFPLSIADSDSPLLIPDSDSPLLLIEENTCIE